VIKSQGKAMSKITWRRHVSDPLGKGNNSTHPRQNYAQAKSANHQTKTRKPQRSPLAHMQAPPEPMQLPWTNVCKLPRKQSSCFSVALTGQTGGQDRPALGNYTGQTGVPHWSGRCHLGNCPSSKIARNHLETFEMHAASQIILNLLPLVDNAWIKSKIQKMQPRASQLGKIEHRMLHMSNWAS
jgi:hypothetical protein